MTAALSITDPDALRARALELFRADRSEFERILSRGLAPDPGELIGWEFDGLNVGFVPGILGIRKFRKGFYRGPDRVSRGPQGVAHGYNIPVRQDGADKPHRAKPSDEKPRRFGFYRVYPCERSKRFNAYPGALLLDYDLGANGLDPSRFLRDYLVKVSPDSADILLGKAYLGLGLIRPFAGYFILRRYGRHEFAG
jgi:hypothetical protein